MKYVEENDLKGRALLRAARWSNQERRAGRVRHLAHAIAVMGFMASAGLAVGSWVLFPTVDLVEALLWLLPRAVALSAGLGLIVALGLRLGGALKGRVATGATAAGVLLPVLFGLTLGLNRWLDPEPVVVVTVPIMGVTSETPSKGGARYFAEIGSWREGETTRRVRITQWDYSTVGKGLQSGRADEPKKAYNMNLEMGRGYFGVEYIEKSSVMELPRMKTKARE